MSKGGRAALGELGRKMNAMQRTSLYARHVSLGAKMVDFSDWEMPLHYPDGIVREHLSTRKHAGLFDVSHMGRFVFQGDGASRFLQHVLSNNVDALNTSDRGAQYTILPTGSGGAVDDAYLYRFREDEYLLVVNAANRLKDWAHIQEHLGAFQDVAVEDRTFDIAMLALQGPMSRRIMGEAIQGGQLPEPRRNAVSTVSVAGVEVMIARTGYTGEPLCFELFVPAEVSPRLWDLFADLGASPVGLGARDTLRLEAGLPLYGHELGLDPDGQEVPVLACPIARYAVSFSPRKADFIGREPLRAQFEALSRITARDYSRISDLPRRIQPISVIGRGVAREGTEVLREGRSLGYVTSGTMVPYWGQEGEGLTGSFSAERKMRSICQAYVDSDLQVGDKIDLQVRGRQVSAVIVEAHLRSDAPPYARPIMFDHLAPEGVSGAADVEKEVDWLLKEAISNTQWRQDECINLIPSEMTSSRMTRLLSITDPAFRYAEHRKLGAFYDAEIFYYQGTDFIAEVERRLQAEMLRYLGCREVEIRLISGQMANAAVFGGMVSYINRMDRKREPRRMRCVMNHNLGKGGHLSAQPMGALRDFVARDPITERSAVVNFPVLAENPYQVDLQAALQLIDQYRPELIILGKSMVLHKEPVAEIRTFLSSTGIGSVLMYDMAHVLGLVGPHFQQPFEEGVDIVTGSTHKTFFGTQRGIIGSDYEEDAERYALWESIERRSFPGSLSNHHLGTMLGLLMAAYEMNHFKGQYQQKVICNAKAFARSLRLVGLDVAGDPAIDFTETHQVIVNVGYARGPEIAERLEANNIICNFQAAPDEEGFSASGALRLGVAEMTRFGFGPEEFGALAELMAEAILHDAQVREKVIGLRKGFRDLEFCFDEGELESRIEQLHGLI
jgi:aminomethyltransferase